MLRRFFSYLFVGAAVFGSTCDASAKEALDVQFKRIKGEAKVTSRSYVAMVAYRDIYHIVSHVGGLVKKSSVSHGQVIQDQQPLYELKILDPGFGNVVINNEYGEVRVIQTKIKQGQFVDKNEVLAYAVPLHEYKVVVKMLANELAQLRQGSSTVSAELFPGSINSKAVQLSDYKVVRPLGNSPFYVLEFALDCKYNDCEQLELSSAVAKVTVKKVAYEAANIPIGYLQNGMKSIYVLNEAGVVESLDIEVIGLDDKVASIKLNQGSEVKVVVKSNRIPDKGEVPKVVKELL